MTALLRGRGLQVAHCTVDRLMRELGMQGVRRAKTPRTTTPGKDGTRAGDLLDRDFTAPAPNRVWIADFTYVRAWTGMGYVAFVVDVYAQRIVGWHAMNTRPAELVLLPLRMAAWARGQQGHPIVRGELVITAACCNRRSPAPTNPPQSTSPTNSNNDPEEATSEVRPATLVTGRLPI